MTGTDCLADLPPGSLFLTRYLSAPLPEHIDCWTWRVVARRLASASEATVLGRLALRLGRQNGSVPVARLSGRTLVSAEPLALLETGDEGLRVEPLEPGPLVQRTAEGRRALLKLARGYLKRAAADHGFMVGLADYVLSPKFRLTDAAGRLGLQTGVVFALDLGPGGVLQLDCDMKSKILRQSTFWSRLAAEPEWDPIGSEASCLADPETFVVDRVLDRSVADRDESLGSSILEYNTNHERYPAGFTPDPGARVVACRVGPTGRVYHYDSQLLHETLDLAGARRLDPEFGAQLAEATRLDTVERERYCSYFVSKVASPGPSWLTFRPEPLVVGPESGTRGHDVGLPRDNLVFGGSVRAGTVEKGIEAGGLVSSPGLVRLGALVPVGREKGAETLLQQLLPGLAALAGKGTRFELAFTGAYHPRNPFKMKAAVEELQASAAELALVLLPGREEGSPYVMLKGELARLRFPSQMVHLDTSLSRRELINILVGVTSKLGRSENWRLGRLLWPPDVFVGLSADRVDDERMAAVATAFDKTGRALDVTVEVFPQEGDAIGESRLLHLLEGALLAYRNVHGALPQAAVVHRDGEFPEAAYKNVWKHFRDLSVDMTLVAVEVGLPPRMGRLRRASREAPEPGTLVLVGQDGGFVITTAPGGLRGSPRPVGFRRVAGRVDPAALGGHLFWLTRMHTGSVTPPRLPATVHFARRVVQLVREGLVPQGTMGSRMLFV